MSKFYMKHKKKIRKQKKQKNLLIKLYLSQKQKSI